MDYLALTIVCKYMYVFDHNCGSYQNFGSIQLNYLDIHFEDYDFDPV